MVISRRTRVYLTGTVATSATTYNCLKLVVIRRFPSTSYCMLRDCHLSPVVQVVIHGVPLCFVDLLGIWISSRHVSLVDL